MQVQAVTVMCPSGFVVRFSAKNQPATNALRATLNSLAGEEIFPVSENDMTFLNKVQKTEFIPEVPVYRDNVAKSANRKVDEFSTYQGSCERISKKGRSWEDQRSTYSGHCENRQNARMRNRRGLKAHELCIPYLQPAFSSH